VRRSIRARRPSTASGLARRGQHFLQPLADEAAAAAIAAQMTGIADENLRAALGRLGAAIKRTWAGIFEKCVQNNPALLPATEGSLRGLQKRHKVMAYIREHPEEIRPFPQHARR